jgi:phosphate transport system permease protein
MTQPSFPGSAEAASAASAESPVDSSGPTDFPPDPRRRPSGRGTGGPQDTVGPLPRGGRLGAESVFRWFTTASGAAVLVIIVAIAIFLIMKAIPALHADKADFWTHFEWFPDDPTNPQFGIPALAFGTLVSAAIALVIAVPVAMGIALCLSHYAHRRLASGLGFMIDLLAAVPSIVFGLWGRDYLVGPVREFSGWLHHYFGWIPLFGSDGPYGKSYMLGGIVLAIMILPIVTSLSREVFRQTPRMNEEAALALGATKWEMIRTAVIPYGRPGLIASVMLGLGRALGETIALALTLGGGFIISPDIIHNGGNTIAANIANKFGEASETGRGALIASGLVLFAITLVVNMIARAIVYRRREFLGAAA